MKFASTVRRAAALGCLLVAAPNAASGSSGDFVFTTMPPFPFPVPHFPTMTAAADLDGDGLADLVSPGRNTEGRVHVLRNLGNGIVEIQQTLELGGHTDWAGLGDLDGDGTIDLALAVRNGPRGLAIRSGIGNGTFATDGQFVGGARDLRGIELVDLDNDGNLDIVGVDYEAARLRIYRNDGSGAFTEDESMRLIPHSGSFVFSGYVTSADLDGDGWIDVIATATGGGRIMQFRNRGDGTLEPAINRRVPPYNELQPGLINTIAVDANNDGAIDLVSPWIIAFLGEVVGVLPNDGAGNFDEVQTSPGSPMGITFYGDAADLDGDGKPDLAVCHALPGILGLKRNLGDFQFAPPQLFPLSTFVRHVLPVDMTGNGVIDLVAIDAPVNTLHILINETPQGLAGLAGGDPPPDGRRPDPAPLPLPDPRWRRQLATEVDLDAADRGTSIGLWLMERR